MGAAVRELRVKAMIDGQFAHGSRTFRTMDSYPESRFFLWFKSGKAHILTQVNVLYSLYLLLIDLHSFPAWLSSSKLMELFQYPQELSMSVVDASNYSAPL